MRLKRIKAMAVLGCVAALALAGCTGGDAAPAAANGTTAPAGASASPSSDPSQAPAADAVTVSRELRGIPVEVTVHPVEVSDGKALLTVDYVVAASDTPRLDEDHINMEYVLDGPADFASRADGIRLVDGAAGKVLPVATVDDGSGASVFTEDPQSDAYQATSMSIHAAPSGKTATVLLPSLGYVPDVPVVSGDADFDAVTSEAGSVTDASAYELRAFQTSYDETSSTQAQGKTVTVTLTSDVLFASSSANLSPTAQQAVAAAAAKIKESADGGDVAVVGHTDDVDTPEFNQTLSEKRAAAVAGVLKTALGGRYKVTSEGRGESQPVAEGTSSEARAANRRVEISFDGTIVTKPKKDAAGIPAADVPTVKAGTPVKVKSGNGAVYSLVTDGFERIDGLVYGTVRLDLVSGKGSSNLTGLLDPEADAHGITYGRGFGGLGQVASVNGFALLTQAGRTYPFDYLSVDSKKESTRMLLGDQTLLWNPQATGETTLATAVWPDTGQDSVTLELPGKFRITDIPVKDS